MAHATVTLADPGGFPATSFSSSGETKTQQQYPGSGMSTEYAFEDIIGKSSSPQEGSAAGFDCCTYRFHCSASR